MGPMSGDVVLATVLFTDIAGSTERAIAMGDDRWAQLLRRHHALVRSQLAKFSGRELGSTGDGFLASLEAPGQAVRCGASIAEAVRRLGLSMRAGVLAGGDVPDGLRGCSLRPAKRLVPGPT